ncbi:MAG: HAD hydrolase family protein [Phycisphaerae bacterium]|nr:HAD hydrolase family protein [Phycisphaerae bacterium]
MSDHATAIRCLCLDVDGVLTDGRVLVAADGGRARAFHVHDGYGIQLFRQALGEVVIISGKACGSIESRARELGLTQLALGSKDKLADLRRIAAPLGLRLDEIAAMGDDWPDLPLMRAVGYAIAPANAVREVRESARFITQRSGGDGAVREAVEHLLQRTGRWQALREQHLSSPLHGATS